MKRRHRPNFLIQYNMTHNNMTHERLLLSKICSLQHLTYSCFKVGTTAKTAVKGCAFLERRIPDRETRVRSSAGSVCLFP